METQQAVNLGTTFQQSTQKNYWIFKNQEEIDHLRKTALENSLSSIKGDSSPSPLTFEEQMLLIHYYQQKLFDVCGLFNLPDKVAVRV